MINPLVSVIIPTRNSEKSLENCLKYIKNQTYKNVEIIIVDNNSKDNTKNIARQYTDKVFNIGPERTTQVNFGIKIANGCYVYYTGSDLIADSNLIEEAVQKCESENFDAIYMNVLTKILNPNIWQKVRAIEKECYFKEENMSAARFYKKEVFLKLNGFDENIGSISDDLEFQHRLNIEGYKTGFINAIENTLDEYSSLSIIIKRSIYYGWFIRRYLLKHPAKVKKQYKLIRNEFKKNKKILLKNKFIFLVFIFYKINQNLFGIIGAILSFISRNNKKVELFLYKINYGRK